MRIAEADNTAQYWPDLGSQQSAVVIEPVSPFVSVKCWANDGSLCRLLKFTDLLPSLVLWHPVPKVEEPETGILLGKVSFLPWQTILEVRKSEFGPASAHCCVEYLIFFSETCSQRKGQILAQQWPIITS